MPGVGKPLKPYFINIANEASFATEQPSLYRSVSGAIKDAPSFQPHNSPIKLPKHSELGANYKVIKGKFIGKISWSQSVHNFRALAHVMGGRIDQPHKLSYTVSTGTFLAAEQVDGDSSGAAGLIDAGGVTTTRLTFKVFVRDEQIADIGNTWTANIKNIHGNVITLETLVGGPPAADEVIDGQTSGAYAVIASFAAASGSTPAKITLKTWTDGEAISNTGGSTATGTHVDTLYKHNLWANNSPESKSLVYQYESLTGNQHLLLGSVVNTLNIKSGIEDAPEMGLDWLYSSKNKDSTLDPEIALILEPYTYTMIDLTVNSVDYSVLFRAVELTFERDYDPSDTHDSVAPKGFTTSSFASAIKATIFKEDEVLLDLAANDTRFPVIFDFLRGTVAEDDAQITFATCKFLQPDEGGDKKITLEVPIEVEGTPTAIIHDTFDNYD